MATLIPTTEPISISKIIDKFGGTANATTQISKYYANNSLSFTSYINGIPNSGNPLKFSNFYNKATIPRNELFAQYTGDGPFTLSGTTITQWNDISGNSRHITACRGTPIRNPVSKGSYGTYGSGNFNVVNGTDNDGFQMPFNLPQNQSSTTSSYTIAYMARYVGNKDNTQYNRRIFESTSTVPNYVWGFNDGYAGRTSDPINGLKTETFYKQSDPNYYIIGVETELNSRFNGIDWTLNFVTATNNFTVPSKSTSTSNTPKFSINFGAYTGQINTSQTSYWEVAELIFYNRELTLEERIRLEEYLALKYGHISFKSVVNSLALYKTLTGITGVYSGWFNVWDRLQYAYLNSLWIGPGQGDFKILGNLGYFGILYRNANITDNTNTNKYLMTYNYILKTASKIHIISCGGGGGGCVASGSSHGGGGGAGALAYMVKTTNLNNYNLIIKIGAKGEAYSIAKSGGNGGNTSISWIFNNNNNTITASGGGGAPNSLSGGSGGQWYFSIISDPANTGVIGSGIGQSGTTANPNSNYIPPGGAIHQPTIETFTYTNVSTNLWAITQLYGVISYNHNNPFSTASFGNGGSGAGYTTSLYNATSGGDGWVLIIYDSNS